MWPGFTGLRPRTTRKPATWLGGYRSLHTGPPSISVGGSILHGPFESFLIVSSEPLKYALAHLNR